MKLSTIGRCFATILIFIIGTQLSGQSYGRFGKNIVQYQTFDWKYIQSEHFDVYYNDGSKYLAEVSARIAEESLKSVQELLNYRINKKIKLIVYDTHNEFQQTNVINQFMPEGVGGVTELMKNRIVVPFQGDYSQFEHTLHHELVHGVMNDMFYGGTFQTALSSGNLGKIPIWISEGICEYESLDGYSVETDMFMRDVALNEKLRDLKQMNGYYAYRGGQAFYWFIEQKYGRERIGDLINRLKVQRSLNDAFKSSFNKDIEEFSEDFKNFMKKYYWPDITKFENPKEFAERITDFEEEKSYYNTSPAISPDGKKLAYISAPGGLFGIFIKNLEKKDAEPRKLVSSFRQQDFEDLNILTPGISWGPNGKRLAISAKSGGKDALFLVDAKTGEYKKLTFGLKSITSVNWSGDGEKLAFVGSQKGHSDIYIYNLESEEFRLLNNDVFSDSYPVWSSDSKSIYFLSDRGDKTKGDFSLISFDIWDFNYNQKDVYSIDLETGKIDRITNSPKYDKKSIAISSDEKTLLYTSDQNGILNVYKKSIDGGKSIPITNSVAGIAQINLSKDDSKLFFSAQVNGGYDIFMSRYPLDPKKSRDSIPLTKYRKKLIKKSDYIEKIKLDKDTAKKAEEEKEIAYGEFKVEFERQQVVKPNPDARKQSEEDYREALKGATDSVKKFVEKDYKITFTPDLISGNPGYSTFWGFQGITQMYFSDILGDHTIMLQAHLMMDLRNSTFFAAYQYKPKIIDYLISAHHAAGFVYYGQSPSGEDSLYRFRDYGASIGASYPFDLFNRIEWGLSWKNLAKENVLQNDVPNITRTLFIPEGRYVHDDVLYGLFAPIRGTRYFVGFKGTPKLSSESVGFLSVTSDFRHYIQLGDYSSIAIRGAGGASMGPNPQNFYLGGTDYWINSWFSYDRMPFNNPEDFAFINSSIVMPLRGFGVGRLSGHRYFLTNIEFRFPFIGWFMATPIPLAQAFLGNVFLDVGGAWSGDWMSFKATKINADGKAAPNNLLMSTGVGLRTVLLGLPLKLDVAWAYLYHNWSKPRYLVSLGFDF